MRATRHAMITLILIYIFLSIASAESCYPIEVTTISGDRCLVLTYFILDTDVGTTDSGGMVYPENDLVDKILGPINFFGLTRYAYVSACYCGSCKGDGRIGTKLNYLGFAPINLLYIYKSLMNVVVLMEILGAVQIAIAQKI